MLRRIGLENFKSWKKLDIELAPITLLFGANSSGKTAILQSLLMLKQTASGVDPGQHLNFGGSDRDYVDLGSYQDIVYGHDTAGKFGVRLSWNTSRSGHFFHRKADGQTATSEFELKSIDFNVVWGLDTAIFIDQLSYNTELVDAAPEWIDVRRESADKYHLSFSSSNRAAVPTTVSSPRSCFLLPREVSNWPPNADKMSILFLGDEFVSLVDCVEYLGPLRIRPERHYLWTGGKPEIVEPDGANAIQALIASSREGGSLLSTVENMLQAMGLVDTFNIKSIDQNQRLYEATAEVGGVESSLRDVGFGVSQVLPVLTMLFSAPIGSIVLLEQPELHLHPNAQAALADFMLFAAQTPQFAIDRREPQ